MFLFWLSLETSRSYFDTVEISRFHVLLLACAPFLTERKKVPVGLIDR